MHHHRTKEQRGEAKPNTVILSLSKDL